MLKYLALRNSALLWPFNETIPLRKLSTFLNLENPKFDMVIVRYNWSYI